MNEEELDRLSRCSHCNEELHTPEEVAKGVCVLCEFMYD